MHVRVSLYFWTRQRHVISAQLLNRIGIAPSVAGLDAYFALRFRLASSPLINTSRPLGNVIAQLILWSSKCDDCRACHNTTRIDFARSRNSRRLSLVRPTSAKPLDISAKVSCTNDWTWHAPLITVLFLMTLFTLMTLSGCIYKTRKCVSSCFLIGFFAQKKLLYCFVCVNLYWWLPKWRVQEWWTRLS